MEQYEGIPSDEDSSFDPYNSLYSRDDLTFVEEVNLFYTYMAIKYNLSSPISESKDLITDKTWQEALIRSGNETQILNAIDKAINPLTL